MDKQQVKKVAKKKAGKSVRKAIRRLGLADISPYLRSLLDPINVWGAKIPDSETAPSFVVHCVTRLQVPIGSGVGGTPCAGVYMTIADLRSGSIVNLTLAGGATPTSLVGTPFNKTYSGTVSSVAQAVRPVSAAIYMSYQGSPLNAKGRVSVALIPPTQSNATLPPVDINADVQSLPYLSTLPANAGFAQVKFLPIDALSKSYAICPAPFVRGMPAVQAASFGALLILLDGGTAGDIVEFTIVENFECLPLAQSTQLSSPSISKSDPFEMALVDNFVAANPTLAVQQDLNSTLQKTAVTTAQQTAAPVQHDPKKHESGLLDKVLSGLGMASDFVIAAAPKVAGIMGAVAPLL